MSKLKEHFEGLMKFAKQSNFRQPFSQVYFAEYTSICRSSDSESGNELHSQDIFTFKDYEIRFDEILKQGYSWVNLNFAGILEDDILLILIELPIDQNGVPFESVSINLSLSDHLKIENNWHISSFFKII